MGKELAQEQDAAQAIFDAADQVSGLPISRLCFDGPMEELTQTVNLQPAVTAVNLAFLSAIEQNGIKPLFVYATGGYQIQSNRPIRTFADLKGKKLAVAGSSLPKWLPASGAVPVSLPGAERYMAMQSGI